MYAKAHDFALASCYILFAEMTVRLMIPRSTSRVRWFSVHALCNFVVAVYTTSAMLQLWNIDENACLPGQDVSPVPIVITVLLHVWHGLAYPLTTDDKFHHLLFIPLIGMPGCVWDWGRCGDAQLWFLNGVPGGSIYTLLAMQKYGMATTVFEPAFTALVTTFVRLPGGIMAALQLISALRAGKIDVPLLPIILQLTLGPFNASYYAVSSMRRWFRRVH